MNAPADGPILRRQESSGLPPDILLVEDGPAELYLLQKAFATGPLSVHVHSVKSMNAALAFLHHEGPYSHAPRPHLVVTSLNRSGRSGLELIAKIKRDPALCPIPVIVVSLYEMPEVIQQSYALGANSYIIKPPELDAFFEAIHAMEAYWLTVTTLPPPPTSPREPAPV